jgi:8-oxo-dGTP pyrophosphatase MutT (NUDIX family)
MKEFTVILLYRKNFSQVLLQRKIRGPKFNIGKLNGIGGKLDDWENHRACAEGEMLQEAGVTPEQLTVLEHFCTSEYPASSVNPSEPARIYVYYGVLRDGVEVTQKEDEQLQWVNSDRLLSVYDLLAGNGDIMHWHNVVMAHYAPDRLGFKDAE